MLSPLLFNCVMSKTLREATEMLKTTASTCIQNVPYADDLTAVAETRRELQHLQDVLDSACVK